jgi:undecaprenyl diphosphate synthase
MHIGIIADGNGRWASSKGYSREWGHRAGADNVPKIVKSLMGKTDYLSLYGFSTENWSRSQLEVTKLFEIMYTCVNGELLKFCESNNIRIYHFGRRDRLPFDLLASIDRATARTSQNTKMHVAMCLDYGYRDEVQREEITSLIFPDLDLVIRTGGEHRLSNFMLYQAAYAEIYFTRILFPDLNSQALRTILRWYNSRMRKFGGA